MEVMNMKIIDEIPQKQAIVQRLEGKVVEEEYKVTVGGIVLSPWLEGKLRRRSRSYDSLQDAVDDKEIYLVGRDTAKGIHWFGLVSGQFKPITVDKVAKIVGEERQSCVRYDEELERFQVGYIVQNTPTKVMMYIDSGDFGVYGGNGESALQYGIAVMDRELEGWSLFQNKREVGNTERTIHRLSFPSLEKVAAKQQRFVENVQRSWEENKGRVYSRQEVEAFATVYTQRCAAVFDHVLQGMNGDMNGYEVVRRLQQEAAQLCGRAQLGLEALAGEMVMYGR